MPHPLSGADLPTIRAVFKDAGPISRKALAAEIWASATARWPSTALERRLIERRLPRIEDIEPPIFILGHWRSGTTHLYNVLAKGDFGYVSPLATGLPWDLFGVGGTFAPLLERALPKSRYIDAIPVNPDSPQEDEFALANMCPISFYHGVYFPRRFDWRLDRGLFFDGCAPAEIDAWRDAFIYWMRKLSLHQKGKRLIIKNPVYTGRVALLRSVFPEAKFVHIHRNPFDVFASMRNFYKKLLPVMALQPYDHVDVDAAVLRVYPRMMERLLADVADLAPPNYLEIAYADLDADPMAAIERIFTTLDLPGFEAAAPRFRAYLAGVKSFQKNRFRRDEEAIAKVSGAWTPFIDRWGYAAPGAG